MDFSWMKSVNKQNELSVSGYIRHSQKILPSNNVYYNIPSLVKYMVLNYYCIREYLAVNNKVQINDQKDIATYDGTLSQEDNTVYGNVMVETDKHFIYEWQVKVLQLCSRKPRSEDYLLGIGIASSRDKTDECFLDWDIVGFLAWECAKIEFNDTECDYQQFEEGDVIKVVINTQCKECTVYINDAKERKVEIDWEKNYYFAVCFGQRSCSVQLINFKQTLSKQ